MNIYTKKNYSSFDDGDDSYLTSDPPKSSSKPSSNPPPKIPMGTSTYLPQSSPKLNLPEKPTKTQVVQKKVDDVVIAMTKNIEIQLENMEKTEDIEKKSEGLMQGADRFRDRAREIKYKIWWKNIKMKLIIGFVIVSILVILIVVSICGDGGCNKKK
jgi:vesicle-associated membrane protein 4